MRFLNVVCLVLLLSGFATAQATTIGGTASNWAPAYGVYLAPYVPLVITPSVTLSNTASSPAGASSSAFGMVAGATNSTLSIPTQAPTSTYTDAVWYGSSAPAEATGSAEPRRGRDRAAAFDFVNSSDGIGIAQTSAANVGHVQKASRTYTNQDVDQVNQTNGTVKYGGKTEHI
jgi:hypothetical protein